MPDEIVTPPVEPKPVTLDDPSLPDHLKGKSITDIIAYYNNRENVYNEQIYDLTQQAKKPANSSPEMPPEPSTTDFYNNPTDSVKKIAVTREEFQQATSAVQSNMIEMAVIIAERKFKDWTRWEPEIRKIMKGVAAHLQTDPEQWVTAYYYVKGQGYDRGVQEAEARGHSHSSEPPTPDLPVEPEMPAELSNPQRIVAKGLGLSDDQYKSGIKNHQDNKWPLTFDSRRR